MMHGARVACHVMRALGLHTWRAKGAVIVGVQQYAWHMLQPMWCNVYNNAGDVNKCIGDVLPKCTYIHCACVMLLVYLKVRCGWYYPD